MVVEARIPLLFWPPIADPAGSGRDPVSRRRRSRRRAPFLDDFGPMPDHFGACGHAVSREAGLEVEREDATTPEATGSAPTHVPSAALAGMAEAFAAARELAALLSLAGRDALRVHALPDARALLALLR